MEILFDEIAETALEVETAIFSKNERQSQGTAFGKLVCRGKIALHRCFQAGSEAHSIIFRG